MSNKSTIVFDVIERASFHLHYVHMYVKIKINKYEYLVSYIGESFLYLDMSSSMINIDDER